MHDSVNWYCIVNFVLIDDDAVWSKVWYCERIFSKGTPYIRRKLRFYRH